MVGREEELFDESMRLGHSAAWDLQWDKEIGFYRKALAESPDNQVRSRALVLRYSKLDNLKKP